MGRGHFSGWGLTLEGESRLSGKPLVLWVLSSQVPTLGGTEHYLGPLPGIPGNPVCAVVGAGVRTLCGLTS